MHKRCAAPCRPPVVVKDVILLLPCSCASLFPAAIRNKQLAGGWVFGELFGRPVWIPQAPCRKPHEAGVWPAGFPFPLLELVSLLCARPCVCSCVKRLHVVRGYYGRLLPPNAPAVPTILGFDKKLTRSSEAAAALQRTEDSGQKGRRVPVAGSFFHWYWWEA